MILTGIIYNIFQEEVYGTFRKRILWLREKQLNNPQTWHIEFWNDDGAWLNKFQVGQLVNVNIGVIGRLSKKNGEEKVYNTIRGIKIEALKR